tara:strand:+ start:271 stop:489 length:219 start_codon:yes stop_codon:yes gene_type:complete
MKNILICTAMVAMVACGNKDGESVEEEISTVEQAQRLNQDLAELLAHLRSIPTPEGDPSICPEPTNTTQTNG